ncbi:TonB-dependent receptor plug domain-containing protein [Neolewinella litorea]|uniref:TonB-dependent receptor n=1 Tax=Neolewinella litorea TaxID=2562452 RepID=A0A4S4NJ44_9BACT|nr:TonB-dependent receptor [Neolewinella litorea]THH39769.1 TonB-dependent receptor [Neolewinella litorea]
MTRLLLLTIFLLSLRAQAQDAPPLAATTEEVIVTGTRYARSPADSPEHVTVIDSAAIARSTSLAALLNEQAGIVVNGAYSNFGKDRSIFMRNGANQYTLILIDGQPLIDPSSLGGAVDLRLLSLEGLQRIEILRGARSLLYGSDAVAGVINLVTQKPGALATTIAGGPAPRPRLHLRAAAQRYGTFEGQASVAGNSRRLDYRLGYDYFTTRGISEAREPENSPVIFGRDGAQRQTLYGTLTYRPTDALTLRPSVRRGTFDGDYDAGAFQDADNRYSNALWLPGLAIDYRKDDLSVGGRYTYSATDRTFQDAAFGEAVYRGRAQQADVFVNLLPSEALALTVGGQLRHERLKAATEEADTLSASNLSPYVQLNLNVAEKLLLEAGLRYNHHSSFGGQVNASAAVGYRHSPVVSSRLSVATAFQSPTLDQLGGPFGANPDLQPQVSTSFEAGARVQDSAGKRRAVVTLFQRNIERIVTYDFTIGYQNQDALRDRGVEVEASTRLSRRLGVLGNFTYVKGRLSSPDGQGGTVKTTDFFRRPRLTGLLGFTYQGEKPFTVRLTGSYTGERPDVFFDADFARFTTELDPYLIVNLYAEYQFLEARNLTLFGEVRNLTDTDFTEVTGFSTLGVTPRAGVAWSF